MACEKNYLVAFFFPTQNSSFINKSSSRATRLENLMRFSKLRKKKVTETVFKLFLRKLCFKGVFGALYRYQGNCWDIADTITKLYTNGFIQITKHCSSDRDTSVVIFLHWTRTVSHGKPSLVIHNTSYYIQFTTGKLQL